MCVYKKPSPVKQWLQNLLPARLSTSPELARAQELLAAIDAGGMPLNPMRVNDIARSLGLEVSAKAPMQDTIERIRRALTH